MTRIAYDQDMRRLTYILVGLTYIVGGCATPSLDDRFRLATECGSGPECQELWDGWNSAAERKERREAERRAYACPDDYVTFCDHKGGFRSPENCSCMKRGDLNIIWRQPWRR